MGLRRECHVVILLPHRIAQWLGDGFYPGRSCVFHQVSKMGFLSGLALGPTVVLVTDGHLGGEVLKRSAPALKALGAL